MSGEDEDFAEKLIAAYRAAEPAKPKPTASGRTEAHSKATADVDTRFAERLMKQANRGRE
jgi:hypothetical protein